MNKTAKALDAAAERLELPAEALGALLVSAVGSRRVLIENHCGVEQYGENILRVRSRNGCLTVLGGELRIRTLGRSKLAVEGKLRSMEWEA